MNEMIVPLLLQYASDNAYYKSNIDMFIKLLNRSEAEANRKGRVAQTALIIACENGHDCIVKILLKIKRQSCISLALDAVNEYGETAPMIAARRKDTTIVDLFMKDKYLTAVENGDEQTVKILLDKSLDDFRKGVCLERRFVHQDQHMTLVLQAKLPPESFIKESWCLEALYVACDKSLAYIANLILDYVPIISSATSDLPLLHRLLNEKQLNLYKSEDVHRIDFLMKTGKVNINAINYRGRPTLSFFCKLCSRSRLHCSGDNHTPASNEILLTLLRYNVNVNQKDREGMTALMIASEKGCVPIVSTILSWASKNNYKLDLDAKDRRGQTALMKAALWKHSEVLQMLIQAGASVNLLDNWDFTALHHAIYEVISHRSWIISGDIRNTSDNSTVEKCSDMSLFNSNEPHKVYGRDRESLNADKSKIFKLLLEAKDFDKSSSNCEDQLFLGLASDIDSKIPRPNYDRHGIGILQRLAFGKINEEEPFFASIALYTDDSFSKLVNEMEVKISESRHLFCENMASQKDQRGRTALHCAVNYAYPILNSFKQLISILISFGCNINERDHSGQTPLHYAKTEYMSRILKTLGANSETDKYGNSAKTYSKLEQHKVSSSLPGFLDNLMIPIFEDVAQLCLPIQSIHLRAEMKSDTEMKPKLFTDKLRFFLLNPFCDQTKNLVMEEINTFMEKLAVEIEKKDPRFGVQIVHVGSSYEGTKIDFPNEFDFCFVLTKFSELCEVCPSLELPTGFVHLKLRDDKKEFAQEKEFHSFFKENGFIILEKVNIQFKIVLKSVLSDSSFIDSFPDYDWVWFLHLYTFQHMTLNLQFVTTLKLTKLNLKLLQGVEIDDISIDIVPCIQIDGWWPEKGISVSDDVKRFGCILVFDWPQRNYPMAPYSESCARVSFAPAESEMIKQSVDSAKNAYMIAKHLTHKLLRTRVPYVLKTSLLYCIGAFQPACDRAKSSGLISPEFQADTQFWLERLFRCYLDFHIQDSCPSYFMPSFSLPIGHYTNTHRYSVQLQAKEYLGQPVVRLFLLYRCLSENEYDRCFEFHGSKPESEKFDREKLMAKLSNSALSKIGIKSDGESDSTYVDSDCPFCSNNEVDDRNEILLYRR